MESQTVKVAGLEFTVLPGVAPVTEGSRLLVEQLDVLPGQRALDLGTGCGVQAVVAALRGATVVATDVVAECLACAQRNAERHGVTGGIDFRLGPGFDPVAGARFDCIVASPPQLPPRTEVPSAIAEAEQSGRAVLDLVLRRSSEYLQPGGYLLLVQFTFHGVQHSLEVLHSTGLRPSVVSQRWSRTQSGSNCLAQLTAHGLPDGIQQREDGVWFERTVLRATKAPA